MLRARTLELGAGLAGVLAAATALGTRTAQASEGPVPAPQVVESRGVMGREAGVSTASFSITLRPPAGVAAGGGYIAEKAWSEMPGPEWVRGRVSERRDDGTVVWTASVDFSRIKAPFGLAYRLRAVDRRGRLGPPSGVVVVAHPGAGEAPTQRSDQLLFLILGAGFLCLWCWYRRETDRGSKIRLAAATALASVLFLSVTPAMPWFEIEDHSGKLPDVECLLGDEAGCATYEAIREPDRLADPAVTSERTFEIQRWECASAALRIGQVFSLVMLLPVLIWLIVAPENRAAQAALAVGASVAAFTLLSVIFFREAIPLWLGAKPYWTADLALMTTVNIVVAAALVVKHALASMAPPLPKAIARRL